MTLGLVDILAEGLDYDSIMKRLNKWLYEAEYTPHGEVFDVGIATNRALGHFKAGFPVLECGGTSEQDNGNGSLMRILPIYYYLKSTYGSESIRNDESFEIIHNISVLTHAHKRSQIACGIYISIASELVNAKDLDNAVEFGVYKAIKYYKNKDEFIEELSHYKRLESIAQLPIEEINTSGYVVDTLKAALWCLLTTKNYKECVLKAVNLGKDTDTVAVVAGGLAGLYYGYERIPEDWLALFVRREYTVELCDKLSISLIKSEVDRLTAYIPYFETIKPGTVASWNRQEPDSENHITLAFPIYDKGLKDFINEFYKTNLVCYNYYDELEKQGYSDEEKTDIINNADLKLIRAILTYYIRQERFMDGLWVQAVEEKVFLNILKRFKKIIL